MNINKIIEFEGKRNCGLTFFIPPNYEFKKSIIQIDKNINGLKHENKKRQLKQVINKIKKEIKDVYQFKNNGIIICCGLNNNNEIEFYQKFPIKKINKIEYFYDYKFNINKIFQNIYSSIEYLHDKDQEKYINNLDKLRNNGLLVYQKELYKYIELNLIKTVLYFSHDDLKLLLIDKSKKYNFNIKLFTYDCIKLSEIQKNYGKYVGILHYKVDWNI
jgi:hypothetical protein